MEIDGFLAAISLQSRLVISTFQSIPWHWKRLPRRRSSASSTRSDSPPLKTHLDAAAFDLSSWRLGGPAQEVQTSVDFRSRGDELRVVYAVLFEFLFHHEGHEGGIRGHIALSRL